MTRRPVQHARRITDRKLIADWPERIEYVRDASHAEPVDIIQLALGTVVMSAVFLALVLALIVATGAGAA